MAPSALLMQLLAGGAALKTARIGADPQFVAVCVGGLPGRLQPLSLLSGLHSANPHCSFHTFYILQNVKDQYYSSRAETIDANVDVSQYNGLGQSEIRQQLESLAGPNTTTVTFMEEQTSAFWQQALHTNNSLDVIEEYALINGKILNMYEHQVRCAELIVAKEAETGHPFDYIVSTREDVFLFHPLDLRLLISDFFERRSCDVVSKGCLVWGGINMRLQILRRRTGVQLLSSRLAAYRTMLTTGEHVRNPETFEKRHMQGMHLRGCTTSVLDLPASVSRIKKGAPGGDATTVSLDGATHTLEPFCFIIDEVRDINNVTEHCIPPSNASFVEARMC